MSAPAEGGCEVIARAEAVELVRIDDELARRRAGRKLDTYFPETGPHRRELYAKHLEFFRLGSEKRERLFLAANRVGKTEGAGGYEMACHLTGRYPPWWQGRRFTGPVHAWAAGDTRETVRDSLQKKLLGRPGAHGTGLIPADTIERKSPGFIPDAVQAIWVRHVSGGLSTLQFKSYDQGREAFQASEIEVMWFDEEPPMDVYTEGLLRTMTTKGMVMLTFTPLRGVSEVVLSFLPGGAMPEVQDGPKAVVSATWDDVPHLTAQEKAEYLAAIPPFQRDARSKGLPQLGSGLIYPVPESVFLCAPFEIPKHWPRSYGLDVGWNRTAAIWGADDPETDIEYWYSEHYQGEEQPAVHAAAIKARGNLPGCIDPAAFGRGQADGRQVVQLYRDAGLELTEALNAVEAGIHHVWERLSTGRLKIFTTLTNTLSEMRLYRRDEKGKVVKERDHAMDAGRYRSMTRSIARAPRPLEVKTEPQYLTNFGGGGAWMG